MKAILMSIRPEWVAKILNGEKTIEIRKKFPKDYVGWVYIYCTKDKNNLLHKNCADIWWVEDKDFQKKNKRLGIKQQPIYNGKVVARFWCDKVDVIYKPTDTIHKSTITFNEIMQMGCLTKQELTEYRCKGGIKDIYAIYITKLEIFDKPKELSEFSSKIEKTCICFNQFVAEGTRKIPLTRAPQSWCYVEIDK